jgi:DNA-binding beta-propeller fold protein YncE
MRAPIIILAVFGVAACGTPDGVAVDLPNGKPGIGFDDLRYSQTLHRVLAPSGRSGNLALIDPETLVVTTVSGFSVAGSYDGGHDFGATSVDEGRGFLFVTDRSTGTLVVIDASTRSVVASTALSAGPDYVRYVAKTDEVWVTEPSASQLEVFSLAKTGPAIPTSVATIPVVNGPESMVVDQRAGRVYTHRWQSSTVVWDAATRQSVAEWPNGCAASRGVAVDEALGFFFAGCSEGTLSVLAVGDGRVLSSISRGAGFDVIGYNATLGHIYMAGTACKCLVMLGVSPAGTLSFLGRFAATSAAHCAAADDRGHAWVCDPGGGRLWRVDDPYPGSL